MSSPARDQNRFHTGESALLTDRKGRQYLVSLEGGQVFHSHLGRLPHDDLIGCSVGGWYRTDRGHVLLAVRPTLGDYVRKMPRGPQIIYPKDLGNIITFADIFPGATVVESGLGSGSLTAALLRAVGPAGQVITYEVEESVVPKALDNIRKVVPDTDNLTVTIGNVYEGIAQRDVDRVVLDVPEPWQAVGGAADALVLGGIFISFLPTVLQVHQLVLALHQDTRFQMVETVETLLRPWHVTERSVRPAHRMVAHSGFLTTAVRCQPRPTRPPEEGDASKPDNESRETGDHGDTLETS